MASEVDPITAFDQARVALVDAQSAARAAEAERDEALKQVEALQKEKEGDWKAKLAEAKKLHPGQHQFLKMFCAATREEWEETQKFFEMFDGHLPVGLVRIAQGAETLLNGVDTK